MRCLIIGVFLSLYSLFAGASDLSVRPLYQTDAHLPMSFIPFQLISGDGSTINISGLSLKEHNPDCRALKDPYRSDVFLVKCLSQAQVNVTIKASSAQRTFILDYGPIKVKNPFDDVVIIEPTPEVDPDVFIGKQLYGSSCFNCHNPVHVKKGRNFLQIKNAILSIPEMNGKKGPNLNTLSDDDIRKIEKYLRNP